MEYVKCLLCKGDDPELLFVGRDRMHNRPGEFRVVRCRKCSLVYLNPRPCWDEMQRFYPVDYGGHGFKRRRFLGKLIHYGGLLKKQKLVQKWKKAGTLLDVGCGNGDFLAIMAQVGKWQLFGVEPDYEASLHAAHISGANIFYGRFEDTTYSPCSFDVITMWHVLEHLYEPMDVLMKIHQILKPGGILLLGLPILDSLDAHLFGPYWAGYDVPRHTVTFSKLTLTQMLLKCGFSNVRFEAYIGGHDAFCISLSYWASERLGSFAHFIRALSQSLLTRVVMWPYYSFLSAIGRSSTAVVLAQKS